MLRRLLGLRTRRPLLTFTPEELEYMWNDDTIDIKNFGNMSPGLVKDKVRTTLELRHDWYLKQGLLDWAEQIDVALWIDKKVNHK